MVSCETLDRFTDLSELSLLTCRMETIIIEGKIAYPGFPAPGAPRPGTVLAFFLSVHFKKHIVVLSAQSWSARDIHPAVLGSSGWGGAASI